MLAIIVQYLCSSKTAVTRLWYNSVCLCKHCFMTSHRTSVHMKLICKMTDPKPDSPHPMPVHY